MMSEVLNSDHSSSNVTAVENTSIQVEKHTMKETSSKATISEAPGKTSSSTENSIISNGGAAFKDVPDQTSRTPKKTCNAVMDSQVVFDHPLSLDKDMRHSDSDDDNFSACIEPISAVQADKLIPHFSKDHQPDIPQLNSNHSFPDLTALNLSNNLSASHDTINNHDIINPNHDTINLHHDALNPRHDAINPHHDVINPHHDTITHASSTSALNDSNVSQILRKPRDKIVLEATKGKTTTTAQNVDKMTNSRIGVYFSKSMSESTDNLIFTYHKEADNSGNEEADSDDSSKQASNASDRSQPSLSSVNEMQSIATNNVKEEDQLTEDKVDNVVGGANLNIPSEKLANAAITGVARKKKKWYNVLNADYKCRHNEFKRLFKDIPKTDRLVVDYSCALQKNILCQGRLYISQNWLCFYANIFGVETSVVLPMKSIVQITKEKTAHVFPNAIQISTNEEKYFFSSLNTRDKTYLFLYHVWHSANSDEPMSEKETWMFIHYIYGDDVGYHTDDEDHIPFTDEEKSAFQTKILREAALIQSSDCLGTVPPEKEFPNVESRAELLSSKPSSVIPKNSVGKLKSQVEGDDVDMEVTCGGHEHFPIAVTNEIINLPVDNLFEQCFSDSVVFRKFAKAKKTTNLVFADWSESPDSNGQRFRNISYTLSLHVPVGARQAPTVEKQLMHAECEPSRFYMIDCECTSEGVPYSDSFCVVSRYCLSRVSDTQSRIQITSKIEYRKSVWSVVRGFIDKNATAGIMESFKVMIDLLRNEANRKQLNVDSTEDGALADQDIDDLTLVSIPTNAKENFEFFGFSISKDSMFHILFILVVLLVLSNAIMYYKLNSLDSGGNYQSYNHQSCDASHNTEMYLKLRKQQVEIDKWKFVLMDTVQMIEKIREMLKRLVINFDQE